MAWMQVFHKSLECIIVQTRFGVSTIGIALSRVLRVLSVKKKQSLYVASFRGKTINKGELLFLNKNRNLVFQEITGSYFISYQSIDPLSSQCC